MDESWSVLGTRVEYDKISQLEQNPPSSAQTARAECEDQPHSVS